MKKIMRKIIQRTELIILGLILSSISGMAQNEGYVMGSSSEETTGLRLNLKRINTGSYVAHGEKEQITPAKTKGLKKERHSFWKRKKEKKIEPTFAETAKITAETALEASKKAEESVKKSTAIAETSLEVSKKAESVSLEALNAAKTAETVANRAITQTNEAIKIANEAVATTNRAIDKINELAEKLKEQKKFEQKAEEEKEKKSQTYQVKKGDSLMKIALNVYGDASLWKKLFAANRNKIKNPNFIYLGQVLAVPK